MAVESESRTWLSWESILSLTTPVANFWAQRVLQEPIFTPLLLSPQDSSAGLIPSVSCLNSATLALIYRVAACPAPTTISFAMPATFLDNTTLNTGIPPPYGDPSVHVQRTTFRDNRNVHHPSSPLPPP
ncbi:hypothetical protein ARMGADRAFT_1091526 [Armillaria gallica]|uniref:Uncharacterized protein n=1 Tax=Armillaria gallica TaxID=47427 RepID=A0A2H3CHA7_ARMGA|nr:hypothetical protein ARMGADRAFT_1091526 [Armillaria gallica]